MLFISSHKGHTMNQFSRFYLLTLFLCWFPFALTAPVDSTTVGNAPLAPSTTVLQTITVVPLAQTTFTAQPPTTLTLGVTVFVIPVAPTTVTRERTVTVSASASATSKAKPTKTETPCGIKETSVKLPTWAEVKQKYDTCKTMVPHTCARDALVALAIWRQACYGIWKLHARCWLRAPTIERCCTEWAHESDKKWIGVATYHKGYREFGFTDPATGLPIRMFTGDAEVKELADGFYRKVLKPGWEHYGWESSCKLFRPKDDTLFNVFQQNLPMYGLMDTNERAEVRIGLNNSVLVGFMV